MQQLCESCCLIYLSSRWKKKAGRHFFDIDDVLAYYYLPSPNKDTYQALIEKYSIVPNKLGINILEYKDTKTIVEYINTGIYPIENIISIINASEVKLKPWEILTSFWQLSNKEFEDNYEQTDNQLKNRSITSLDFLIDIAFKLINFERLSLHKTRKSFESDVMCCYNKITRSLNSYDEIVSFRKELNSLLHYYSFNEDVEIWTAIRKKMFLSLSVLERKAKKGITQLLESLNTNTMIELRDLITAENSKNGNEYATTPIFSSPNPNKVVKGILALSNNDRNDLTDIIHYHYSYLNVTNYEDVKFYEAERNNVENIVNQLKKRRLSKIDKYTVEKIIAEFEVFLNHSTVQA